MSADRWSMCPKCKIIAYNKKQKEIKKVNESYGVVSSKEYNKAMLEAESINHFLDDTLRQDFEFWMDEDGSFSVTYAANCKECDFAFKFNHSEQCDLSEGK